MSKYEVPRSVRWFIEADVSMRNSRMGILSRTPGSVPRSPAPFALTALCCHPNTQLSQSQGAGSQRRVGERAGRMELLLISFLQPHLQSIQSERV